MKNVYEVIRRPLLTEKSTLLKEGQRTLVFEVQRRVADATGVRLEPELHFVGFDAAGEGS